MLEIIYEISYSGMAVLTKDKKCKNIDLESIDKLEKSEIKELKFYDYDEKYRPFVWIAGILLLLEIVLRKTIFRSFI